MKHNYSFRFCLLAFLLFISVISKAQLQVTFTVTNTCSSQYDGSITANPSGGTPPYTYKWSNGPTTQTISGLAASYYQVVVTDVSSNVTKDGLTLIAPEPPTATYSSQDPSGYHTFDGSITLSVSGGATPYSYLWYDGPSWQNRTGLGGGDFHFMVTDNNGCSTDPVTVYLTEPPRDDWSLTGSAGTNPTTNFIGTTDNKDFVFKTNATERMRLYSNGNFKVTNDLTLQSLSGSGNRVLFVDANGKLCVNIPTNPLQGPVPWLTRGNDNINATTGIAPIDFIGTVNNADFVVITNKNNVTNGGERMRFTSSGKIGIGTLDPINDLDIAGSVGFISNAGSSGSIAKFNANGVLGNTPFSNNSYVMLGNGTFGPVPSSGNASYWSLNNGNLKNTNGGNPGLVITSAGLVGIGIVPDVGDATVLQVEGTIGAREVKVTQSNFPDYVFNSSYNLRSLSEVENYIKLNRHLPEIPSAAEVESNNGIELGVMQAKLLQKIEELTLYIIEQDKKIDKLQEKINK